MLSFKRTPVLSLAMIVPLLAGCAGDSRDLLLPEQVSMEAVIQGAVDEVFVSQDGNVSYATVEPARVGTAALSARSESDGTAMGLKISRNNETRFATGSFVFGLTDPSAMESGARFEVWRQADGVLDRFVADRGTLEVKESTAQRLEGSFEVEAFRFCRETHGQDGYVPVDGPCEIPGETIEGAPRITVTGTFAVEGL